MRSLPPKLITKILIRSQVKCLLRFRCLSKRWCSEIDSPEFVKLHLSSGSPQPLIYYWKLQYQLAEDFVSLPREENFLPLPFRDDRDTDNFFFPLLGSCNGLVVIRGPSAPRNVTIWNPFTAKHRILSLPRPRFADGFRYTCGRIVYGFGYDSLSDDYKLFRLVLSNGLEVSVYSFKYNVWKNSYEPSTNWIGVEGHQSVVAHGALHFMVAGKYSPINETDYNIFPRMEVLGGRLCLYFGNFNTGRTNVWVMENYGGEEESWTRLFSLDLPSVHDYAPPSERWKELLSRDYWTYYECIAFKARLGNGDLIWLVPSVVSVGEDDNAML